MARGRKRSRGRPEEKKESLLREEQGDLLAEALNGVLGGAEMDLEPPAGQAPEEPPEEAPHEPPENAPEEAPHEPPENAPEESPQEPPEGAPEESPEEVAEEDSTGNAGEESGGGDGVPGGTDPGPEAADGEPAPGAEAALGSEDSEPLEAIPDSPWEQKMAWAKERVREGRKSEALGLYRELLLEKPTSIRALNNLGILLDEMGEHEEAVVHLTRASELDPENLEVMGNLGTALGTLGRYDEADALLRKVLRHDPSNAEVRGNLGILFFRRGLYAQAEAELAAVCRDRPDYGLAHYYWGETLSRLGRVDAAIEALERSLEVLPGNPRAYYALGILLDLKNLPEEAAVMYRRSREQRNR